MKTLSLVFLTAGLVFGAAAVIASASRRVERARAEERAALEAHWRVTLYAPGAVRVWPHVVEVDVMDTNGSVIFRDRPGAPWTTVSGCYVVEPADPEVVELRTAVRPAGLSPEQAERWDRVMRDACRRVAEAP